MEQWTMKGKKLNVRDEHFCKPQKGENLSIMKNSVDCDIKSRISSDDTKRIAYFLKERKKENLYSLDWMQLE